MRQLTEHEQRFIGTFLVMAVIVIIPYSIIIETTRQPMIDWGKSILKTNDPLGGWGKQMKDGNYTNIYTAILYVILDYTRALSAIVFFKPALWLTLKMGFPNDYPPNWLKYINFHCKNCDKLFKTRKEFNTHKKVCVLSTLSQGSKEE